MTGRAGLLKLLLPVAGLGRKNARDIPADQTPEGRINGLHRMHSRRMHNTGAWCSSIAAWWCNACGFNMANARQRGSGAGTALAAMKGKCASRVPAACAVLVRERPVLATARPLGIHGGQKPGRWVRNASQPGDSHVAHVSQGFAAVPLGLLASLSLGLAPAQAAEAHFLQGGLEHLRRLDALGTPPVPAAS